jgi:carbamoyltransferase
MLVLGLNYLSHNAAATIVRDGKIIAACEEERFNRQKHSSNFPSQSVEYCLSYSGVKNIEDVDAIALFVNPRLHYKLGLFNLLHGFPKSVFYLPYVIKLQKKRYSMKEVLEKNIKNSRDVPLRYINHHDAHAASTFYPSPHESATILTIDGRGEFETTCIYAGKHTSIKKLHSIKFPHSVGYLYSMITRYLGFNPQSDEYKVMGLSSYGTSTLCEKFSDLAFFNDCGNFKLNLDYFDHHYKYGKERQSFSQKFINEFGKPRLPDEPVSQYHSDIAFALQQLTEKIVLSLAKFAKKLTNENNLCIAGGVGLNCVANSKIAESGCFENMFVQPAANDAGASTGAALQAYYIGGGFERHKIKNVYLGPDFSEQDLLATFQKYSGQIVTKVINNSPSVAAQLLYKGCIIGWFQDRMEFGPRALGNRSILASPTDKNVKELINKKVKFREEFRPFAPAVLKEHAEEYFTIYQAGHLLYPYMLCTVTTKPNMVEKIPAVVHVDGTARIQVVEEATNPKFWRLIYEYYQLSGIPVILNTSFNIKGEPIVCSVKDAIESFLRSDLDYVIVENYLLEKLDVGADR